MNPTIKRFVLIGGLAAFSCAALVMIALGLRGNRLLFFYAPSMVVEGQIDDSGPFRLGGLVAPGSWVRKEDGLLNIFNITDCHASVRVTYRGMLPDLFVEGQGAVVRGRYDPKTKTIVADQVLARHDEAYTPKEVEGVLRESAARPGEYQMLLEQGCEGLSQQGIERQQEPRS